LTAAGDQNGAAGTDDRLLLADASLGFGLSARAASLYGGLGTSGEVAKSELKLAHLNYERGDYAGAEAVLNSSRSALTGDAAEDATDLLALSLMAQSRYSDAAGVLSAVAPDPSPYTQFNLGVAQLKSGQSVQGRTTLEKVGRIQSDDPEVWKLRDKANVVLGYDYLKDGLGKFALPIFGRIHKGGPFTSLSYLGSGWAQLAPDRVSPGTDDKKAAKSGGADALQQAQQKKALVPWVELLGMDPQDAAVQECLVAIPQSLDHLGASGEAQSYYERAIAALQKNRESLDQASARVASGKMLDALVPPAGGSAEMADRSAPIAVLPDTPETYYLQILIAGSTFQDALSTYRDLLLLDSSLSQWTSQLSAASASSGISTSEVAGRIAALRPQLASTIKSQRASIEAMATKDLEAQKKTTNLYLVEARLALGRLYDRGLGTESHP